MSIDDFDRNFECLRVCWSSFTWGQVIDTGKSLEASARLNIREDLYLATGGADGKVKLWRPFKQNDSLVTIEFNNKDNSDEHVQIYCLQFIESWSLEVRHPCSALLTSENDLLHVFAPTKLQKDLESSNVDSIDMSRLWSFRFEQNPTQNVAYGGDRNPNKVNFVFDASFCQNTHIIAVALSDGTIRLLDGFYGIYLAILEFPRAEIRFHLSGLSWNSNGTKLATCLSLGQVCLWNVDVIKTQQGRSAQITNTATFNGGHDYGRPIFGAIFVDKFLITWGVDGKICAWDCCLEGPVINPLMTLVNRPEYPVYAMDTSEKSSDSLLLAVGGGGSGGFIGVPVYLYDVTIPQVLEVNIS